MFIAHLIAFFSLLFATKVDLEIREVPDLLSYGLIGSGIFLGVVQGVITQTLAPITTMGLGLILCTSIGCVMYYAGQWGGGDAKLLMGLGALFGATPFLYQFLLFLVFAGAIYGLGYSTYLAILHRKAFKQAFHKRAYSTTVKRLRYLFQAAVFLALLLAFFVIEDILLRLLIVIMTAGGYVLFYLLLFSRTLEEVCMKKYIPVSKLVEGDWVVETIRVGKQKITSEKTGITQEQIALLKKNKVKKVLVKEGIPFVPSFLLAYFFTLIAIHIEFSFIIPFL